MLFICFPSVPEPPVIDLSLCRVYNEGLIHWRLSEDSLPTDHHIVEFRKLGGEDEEEEESRWMVTERVYGSSTVVSDLAGDCRYAFRVKSCRNGLFSPCSPEVTFHTPPAPGKTLRTNIITHTRVHCCSIIRRCSEVHIDPYDSFTLLMLIKSERPY